MKHNSMIQKPMVALRGLTVLPEMNIHFDISRNQSVLAVEQAMANDQILFLSTQKSASVESPNLEDLEEMGTIVKIKQITKMPNKSLRALVEGLHRGRLLSLEKGSYLNATVEVLVSEETEDIEEREKEAMLRQMQALLIEYIKTFPKTDKYIVEHVDKIKKLGSMVDIITMSLPLPSAKKQAVLNSIDVLVRFETLAVVLENEIHIGKIRARLQEKVRSKVDRHQKEYVLREQLKLIREELGESDSGSEADIYVAKLEELQASDEVKSKIKKEINRFRSIPNTNPESGVQRNYIETLLEIPWEIKTKDNLDLKRAAKVLDEKHYGMEQVKDRILEFLAVLSFKTDGKSPIICLVGPPGTGKSSIAKSIAHSLSKEYIRVSLGGLHDEAEIRGHRKTYIGAMPGRIATGLKQAGSKNPVMLLDEIDKVGVDYRGDAFAALLEVLDPEQNKQFRDNYVEVPIDLSEVLFVATANDLSTIPRPLLDRMDIIQVSSYTANEKFHIAKKHLVQKQALQHGMSKKDVSIADAALRKMISDYTKESGVRGLERVIGELYRKTARKLLMEELERPLKIKANQLTEFLGKEKYHADKVNTKPQVGIVRGLAWTSVGGDTLEIQVNVMPGKGEMILTGQMGDVMKESATIALSFVRSIASEYEVSHSFFEQHNFHLHIPQGAVPKDGPSAGITMATAILSAVTTAKVNHLVAMTGEINLRGNVLAIGGLKEKLLAANMAGIKKVLIPIDNARDLEELSEEIIGAMEVIPVSTMKEVIEHAFLERN